MIAPDKKILKLQARIDSVERGIEQFSDEHGHYTFIEDAAFKICSVYFRILKDHIKPLVPTKINKFKIAATTAMTIVKIQPITHKNGELLDESQLRKENALLGYFIGVSVILDMMYPNGLAKETGIALIDDSLQEITQQHLKWLELKKLDDFPIFPVAAFYYVFFTMFKTSYNAIMT